MQPEHARLVSTVMNNAEGHDPRKVLTAVAIMSIGVGIYDGLCAIAKAIADRPLYIPLDNEQ